MGRIKLPFVACCLLWASLSGANPQTYDYPITSPYLATVIGTPAEYRASLPERINIKELQLTVFENRAIPELLWYSDRLRYSLVFQKKKAPLVFAIAGTGSSYNSPKMQVLQRALFQAGFHVISLSSSTHPNFVVAGSETGIPGHLVNDSRDLFRAMKLAWQQVKDRITVSKFYLTGFSLGAAQAAFISKLDEEERAFNFRKVLMINPPVSLYNSVVLLDRMLNDNLPGGLDNFNAFFNEAMRAFTEVYRTGDFIDFNNEFLYAAYRRYHPDDATLAAVIGLAFRLASANMIFTADVFTNSGYIVPKNLTLSSTDSMTDYFKVSVRTTFLDYFNELFFPFFKKKRPDLSQQELLKTLSLKSIEDYLRDTNKITLVTNEDDLILQPGELDYLRWVFQSRAKIYPRGGHGGNIDYKDNIAHLVEFFQN